MPKYGGEENARALITWYLHHPEAVDDEQAVLRQLSMFTGEEIKEIVAWLVGFAKGLMVRNTGLEGEFLISLWATTCMKEEEETGE